VNPRSLRFRLVAWYAVGLAAVFLAAGALIHFGLRHYLERNLVLSQSLRARRVASLLLRPAAPPERDLAAEITASFAPEVSSRFIRVTRPGGTIAYQSGAPHDRSFDPAQIPPPLPAPGVRKVRQSDGTELILVTVPAGTGYLVETGESLAPALTELRRLIASLALGFSVVAAVALIGGFVLLRRALRPVEEITRSAEGITSRNLSERLPVPPSGDEFAHLSLALNRMIARLDEAFQHNRRFLADASHELRTPLAVLRAQLEAMERRADPPADFSATVGDLLEEIERLSRLVENLFALSRLDAGQAQVARTRFDFAKLASTTAEQMCLLAEDKGLRLSCDTPVPVFVEGDRARLKQVVVNLLDNAIKYTPSGGMVRLKIGTENSEAVCEVTDSGIGIPAEALPKIFDRFFRVDPARSRDLGGAGIGLAIVKAICLAHDGRIEVTSAEGQGTRCCVRFPLVAPVAEPAPVSIDHHEQ
jgi:heavy metal sensor kinase